MVTPSTDAAATLTGGCLCGALRYRITPPLMDAAYCHCRMCQKASGAPAMPWVSVPVGQFLYTQGTPKAYRSSDWARREFCGACGSPLVFRYDDPTKPLDVAIPSLDDPAAVVPAYHIWRQSRLPWFETTDALPRHDAKGDDH